MKGLIAGPPAEVMPRRPLVPGDLEIEKSVPHAAWAAMQSVLRGGHPIARVAELYPGDHVARAILVRATIAAGDTSTPGWAEELVQQATSRWLGSLVPGSAAAVLITAPGSIELPIEGEGSIAVPIRSNPPAAAPWVAEGGPIPAFAGALTTTLLRPKKIGILVPFSRELSRLSAAASVFTQMLQEVAAVTLDTAYFSATVISTAAHPGLLNGLVAGTGTAVMVDDLAKLAESVGTNGSGQVVFVMAPGRAAVAAVRMLAQPASGRILPSLAVPADRVIALDPVALVHSFGPLPDITASGDTTIQFDTAPVDIGVPGAPATVAAPTKSLFQTAQIALRMLLDVAFATRRSGAVAFTDGCTW
jgi:hypothetical protein